jgi:hypothetical protein
MVSSSMAFAANAESIKDPQKRAMGASLNGDYFQILAKRSFWRLQNRYVILTLVKLVRMEERKEVLYEEQHDDPQPNCN